MVDLEVDPQKRNADTWFTFDGLKDNVLSVRDKIGEAGESVTGCQAEAPGVKDGSGCPVSVSVDRIPSMLETFRVMNSMACCGESAVKTTTASWAPKVSQAPCTSMPDAGRFSRFFSSLATAFKR